MVIFTLSVNFVNALDIFPDKAQAGIQPGDSSNETMGKFTEQADYPSGFFMDNLWAVVLTATGAIGIVVAWITKSTAIIGVYVFSVIFWASYINALSIINLANYVPLSFIGIGTGGMLFVWIGAVAGMLSGSG